MKNAEYNTQQVRETCERKLEIEFRTTGKEFNGWFKEGEQRICRITIPKGRKGIGRGLYHSMATQLYLSNAQFDDLLDCPLMRKDYKALLLEKGKIRRPDSSERLPEICG